MDSGTSWVAERPRRWPYLAGGVAVGAATLALTVGAVGVVESTLIGGQTREWCEGTAGYDSPAGGPLERCVRERDNRNVVAADEHLVEFYRKDSGGERYEPHPWPLHVEEVEVDFGEDGVTITGDGVSATYPNSVYDDAR